MKSAHYLKTSKIFFTLLALVVLTATFSSCKKDNNDEVGASAYIMATNTAEGSAAQDVWVDDNKVNANGLAYTQSTGYATVKAGDRQVQFRSSGTTTVNGTVTLNAGAGNYYSVFYLDDKSTVVIQDNPTAPQSGKARLRFINLSSALNSNVDFGLAAGAKLVSGLARKVASAYYDVDAAAASFALYAAGSSSVLLNFPVTFQAGHVYTVYISGSTESTLSYHVIMNK